MIKDPQVNDKVECRLHPESPWRKGRVESRYEDPEGQLWCVVELDSGAHTNFLAASSAIRAPTPAVEQMQAEIENMRAQIAAYEKERAKPKKRPEGISSTRVFVTVRAEIELELPAPWTGDATHDDLVPIAQREGRDLLAKHLPPRGATILSITNIQTRVASEFDKRKS